MVAATEGALTNAAAYKQNYASAQPNRPISTTTVDIETGFEIELEIFNIQSVPGTK